MDSAKVKNTTTDGEGNKARNEKENEGGLLHIRHECRVIKMTSDGGATNIVSPCRWTHNEDGFQGLWLCTKSREDKDEVQQEHQFSPPSSPPPLMERFTGRVMTTHKNDSHILLQSDNGIHSQSNLPQNKVFYLYRACVCVWVLKTACHRKM